MLTLQQIEKRLDAILGDAYSLDSSVRHSPFYQAVNQLYTELVNDVLKTEDNQFLGTATKS